MTEVYNRDDLKRIIGAFVTAFQFSSTPQGEDFWIDIVKKLEAIRDEGHTHKAHCIVCDAEITKKWTPLP